MLLLIRRAMNTITGMRVVDIGGEAELSFSSVVHPTAVFVRVAVTALRAQVRRSGAANHATTLFLASDNITLRILKNFGCFQSDHCSGAK
jgi:hypothetical protein